MDNTSEEQRAEAPSMMTYGIGVVLVVAVVTGAWYFRSNSVKSPAAESIGQPAAIATPISDPITQLGCDQQYYNPRIGFPEYYLSVEGGDITTAQTVTCTFTARVDDQVVAQATVNSPLTDSPARGGSTFRCTTQAIKLAANVPTVVNVVLSDDLSAKSSCSATFTFQQQ